MLVVVAQPVLLYGTPLWRLKAPERLMAALPGIAARIQGDISAGVFDDFDNRSNFHGYQSPQLPFRESPYFGQDERSILIQMIHGAVGLSKNFGISAAINCSPVGSSNSAHVHPNAEIAGAFYISVPRDSGLIVFRDPRPQCEFSALHRKFGTTIPSLVPRYPVQPETGDLLLFPAWLMHQVEPGQNEADLRISMAININGLAVA